MAKITDKGRNYRKVIIILSIMLVAGIIVSFTLGRYPVTIKELLSVLLSKIKFLNIEQFWENRVELIIFNVRFPRIIISCLVGCCLAAAGASYQGVFQNPMASPDILGASSAAGFGAALAIILELPSSMVTLFAFAASLVCVLLVIFVSERAKGKKVIGLILAGIMISSLFSAATSYLKLVADPNSQLPEITYWLMGSFNGAEKSDVAFAIIPMVIGLVPLLILRWRINILTMGDDEARTMGVNAKAVRLVVILASTLITAASVAVSGVIGWVGLVVPHLARRLVGNNFKYLMPATMLFGAIFMLIVDNLCRNVTTTEIPIGIVTAFVGAPFFVYLLTREGERI